jgi:magnesium transporter
VNDREQWEILHTLVDAGDARAVERFLGDLAPSETAWTVSRLPEDSRNRLVVLLEPSEAADLLHDLPEEQAADLLEDTSAETAAAIVEQMPAHEQADILGEVDDEEAEAILDAMPRSDGELARQLLQYAEGTAGAIMRTEFLAYRQQMTVREVIADMRQHVEAYSDYEVQYAYVTSSRGRLLGVLRLRDLLMSRPAIPISSIMIRDPLRMSDEAKLVELRECFATHDSFLGVPVTDTKDRLVGIVTRSAVEEAEGDEAKEAFLKLSGIVGGEEFRSMPFASRSVRRLAWLCPNILLNILAASVIAMFQDTLQAVIALAVFLPIISDMSGCSGNQSVAVSIRELSLGLLRPTEFARVLLKEAGMGLVNGAALGLLLGLVAVLWKGNLWLGLVVGGALALNTVVSVSLGGLVPLLLRRLRVDPALASGPILTTATDMCGFFLVLGFATLTLPLVSA